MELSINEKKDLILNYFRDKHKSQDANYDKGNVLWSQLSQKVTNPEFSKLVESLIPEYIDGNNNISITIKGLQFEGFVKADLAIKEKEKKIEEKLELDLKHARKQSKWFYPILYFTLITGSAGLIIATISLLVNIGYINSPSYRQKKIMNKIDTISSLYQTKMEDSTHISNIRTHYK